MALGSMILGIISVVMGVPGCCCCGPVAILAALLGAGAVVLGFLGKSKGSEGFALTGIICGFVAIALGLVYVIWFILGFFLNFGAMGLGAIGGQGGFR